MGNTLQKLAQNQSEQESPVTESPVTESPDESFTCEICIEPILLPNKKFKNQNLCVHPFCMDCMVKYISVKLEDNVGNIPCPSLSCENFLDPISCRNLVGPQLFVRWSDVLCESSVLGLAHCYCPDRRCSTLILDECGGNAKRSKCPNCKMHFCFQCKLPWHSGFQCEESRELRDRNDVVFGVVAEANKWKRCPQCRHFVELIEGCKIVKCRCGASFCYNCGKRVHRHWCNCDSASVLCIRVIHGFTIIFILLSIFFIFRNLNSISPKK
ncbi:E3 ubiquitin-protein ligase RSL1-like [Solanum stenotomum]|uniref:E3 ubiquitin-protein ligase RSL1-like n=1 Tax=Solanum stenotomum TaxID=172797 RepID=UPI0020D084F7|nr:E3 ubiquitin-protein ligase RSL1-like [Solanum stenotomum]